MRNTDESILAWVGRIGPASAEDVASRFDISAPAARGRLAAYERRGLVEAHRLLHGQPPLYAATRAGLRRSGAAELQPCRVSPAGFNHLREVAHAAVALERALPGATVIGERELRALERAAGRPLASAELGLARDGGYARHRPDLVLWHADPTAPPLAIEVELTVKAAPRLRAIVRAWARSRLVAAVVYYASPAALRALRIAVAAEQAEATVHLVDLARVGERPPAASTSPVPSRA